MVSKSKIWWAAVGAAGLMLAACGGGGAGGDAGGSPVPGGNGLPSSAAGAEDGPPALPGLLVSGTAATGAALSNAKVEAKCATGNGTATTSSNGAYSLVLVHGALPCMLEATGTQGGAPVLLHSLVIKGTLDQASGRTSATAHLTPITEMVVAHLAGKQPAAAFAAYQGFGNYAIDEASRVVVAALRRAGLDLGGADPFHGELVPSTGGAKGSAYDQALDAFHARLGPQSLALVTNHIALAAANSSPMGLEQAASAVAGGSLQGCPVALSGKYRSLQVFGPTALHQVDFTSMKFQSANGVDLLDIVADPAHACAFTATGTERGSPVEWKVSIGPTGAGAFRSTIVGLPVESRMGYLFPAQAHGVATLEGLWTFVESGFVDLKDSQGFFAGSELVHAVRQTSFSNHGTGTACLYDPLTWACASDPHDPPHASLNFGDGSVQMDRMPGIGNLVNFYGYAAPGRSVVLFGVSPRRTSIVGTRQSLLEPPGTGTVQKSWVAALEATGTAVNVLAPATQAYKILASNSTTKDVTRQRESDGRRETVHANQPIAGVSTRDAGVYGGHRFPTAFELPLGDSGLQVSGNSVPAGATGTYSLSIGVLRP
jgi:hypothetical protein